MMRNIYDAICPACKSVNFIDNGDISDLSAMDVSEFTCWNCKAEICLLGGEFGEEFCPHVKGTRPEDDQDFGNHTEGLKSIGT